MLEELASSGLVGHGGAWFPVSTKWEAIATARRRPVVIANGAEGEPASRKDALLLAHAPHLVLDGLALAASTLRAQQAIAYVPASIVPVVTAALAERRARRIDPIVVEVFESTDTYIAGQETAVVNALGGRRGAVPSFVGLSSIREHGVGGRPTLVQNAETLAHVALIGRFGAAWFREIGSPETPGSMLLTVNRPGSRLVVEAVLGSWLHQATGLQRDELAQARGILLGGYGGAWVSPETFAELAVSEKSARRAGATLGAGVVALLPARSARWPKSPTSRVTWRGRAPGSAGPASMASPSWPTPWSDSRTVGGAVPRPEHILEMCNLVEGRGACRHPDGVARFVRTALKVFAEEVAMHQRRGPCPQTSAARALPVTNRAATRRSGEQVVSRWSLELVIDPVACDGRGVCAEMFPERVTIDRWGYPIVDGEEIPLGAERSRPARGPGLPEAGPPPGGAPSMSPTRRRPDESTTSTSTSHDQPEARDADRPRSSDGTAPGDPASPRGLPASSVKVAIALVLAVFLIWLAVSLGGALTNPALGSSFGARFAEWAREHGGAGRRELGGERVVQPPPAQGGRKAPAPGTIRKPTGRCSPRRPSATTATSRRRPRSCPSPARPSPAKASGRRRAGWSGDPGDLRDDAAARRHPHQLRGRRGLDGHQAAEGHAVLGQPDPRGRPLHHTAPIISDRRPTAWSRRSTPAS